MYVLVIETTRYIYGVSAEEHIPANALLDFVLKTESIFPSIRDPYATE